MFALLLKTFLCISAIPLTLAVVAPYDPVEMLCLVNTERVKNNLAPLGMHSALEAAAKKHSNDQANVLHEMTHDDPNNQSLSNRVVSFGYEGWRVVGENVAFGYDNEDVCMTAWMNSPGHRANILSNDFTHFGSAMVLDDKGVPYYTQEFAGDGKTYKFEVCPKKSSTEAPASSNSEEPAVATSYPIPDQNEQQQQMRTDDDNESSKPVETETKHVVFRRIGKKASGDNTDPEKPCPPKLKHKRTKH